MIKSFLQLFLFAFIGTVVVATSLLLISRNSIVLDWYELKLLLIIFIFNVIFTALILVFYPDIFQPNIEQDQKLKALTSGETKEITE